MSGKVAMVTGASSGFGVHFAKIMAARGAKVVVAARRVERLEALVAEIKADGGEALAVAMDVTDSASIIAAFDQAEAAFGTVTMLANNAGVAQVSSALKIGEDDWDRMIDTNLKGVWIAGQQAAKRMIAAGVSGSIVNTASILGLRVAFGQSSYSASKAAVIQLTKSMALEWAGKGVRVNALCPGYFLTEMTAAAFDSPEAQAYLNSSPAGRPGDMDEMTAPFLLLASDAGSYLHGIALPVDGGQCIGRM
ncbi:MAG: SDR family NAD(P)-dependent oxidoreductase [Porticoccaceae bacterium]|nr:SDR family NAD(P)-dependent oxidoreductase [Porticoccaceae bacterium]MBT5578156.1 SDR family NAD(P)-dependent oxidoreductase [Porticoccaceae bacterium]MBT7374941.1 SDR family NAD(P)-dependent oxidoreductase [Porticoccaceae bacterium]